MSLPSFSLENKVAIVTGGGTGIGKAIALTFAEAGANVIVASRKLDNLEKVTEEVKALGKRSLAVQTDITQKADVDNLVQRVVGEFDRIDILVNNAGVDIGSMLELSEEDWDKTIDTNLKGCYFCCQAVGKRMIKQKGGNIINIASNIGIKAISLYSAYCASKAGVVMLTKVLALDLASYNIRVNAIAPGWVRTDMAKELMSDPKALKEAEAEIPLGRLAEPEDISRTALFLASEASSYITGHTVVVDGGVLA